MHNGFAVENLVESYHSFVDLGVSKLWNHHSFYSFWTPGSSWPSLNFKSGDHFERGELQSLVKQIKEGDLSKVLLLEEEKITQENQVLLKESSFMPVAQWINMYKEFSDVLDNNNELRTITVNAQSLANWRAIVNEVLFPNQKISDEVLEKILYSDKFDFYISYIQDIPVSTCLVYKGTTAGIYMVATDQRFQRKGYAKKMLQDVHLNISKMGYPGVYLHSTKAGVALYNSLGYQSFNKLTLFYYYG